MIIGLRVLLILGTGTETEAIISSTEISHRKQHRKLLLTNK